MWTLAPVIIKPSLAGRLHSEATSLDQHSASWVRRLSPLLREAGTCIAELEGRLWDKRNQVAELLIAVCEAEKRLSAAEARVVELERAALERCAAINEIAELRTALLLVEEMLKDG